MSNFVEIGLADLRPVPLTSTGNAVKKCASPNCNWQFTEGNGFVPDLPTLYEQNRGTDVRMSEPLSRAEVLQSEFCSRCVHDSRFQQFGISLFPTIETLELMEAWVRRNVSHLNFEWRHGKRQVRKGRQEQASDNSPMNRLFKEGSSVHEKHKKPGQRYMNAGKPRRNQEPPPKKGKGNKRHGGGR
jgi:hypothetical protein